MLLTCICTALPVQIKQLFPREGSPVTPPHPTADFKWKDYCPMAFRKLREVFNIDAGDYMLSVCGGTACMPGRLEEAMGLRVRGLVQLHRCYPCGEQDCSLITKGGLFYDFFSHAS